MNDVNKLNVNNVCVTQAFEDHILFHRSGVLVWISYLFVLYIAPKVSHRLTLGFVFTQISTYVSTDMIDTLKLCIVLHVVVIL